MSRYSKKPQVSSETQEEALTLAKATQRPGQTKEQTKLIAIGIQKGINLYKKQQKEKSRELNKKLKKVSGQLNQPVDRQEVLQQTVIYRQYWLPWLLLISSWAIFLVYFFLLSSEAM